MQLLRLDSAISLIKQECEQSRDGTRRPFFFIVGAGISSPPLPLAHEIVTHCRSEATRYGRTPDNPPDRAIDNYSVWFQLAYPAPVARQAYLRELIQGRPISEANLRLAHILLSRRIATTVVTPNFDDFLSRALTLFGESHVLCDHPQTTERIDPDAGTDIQIVHVHGSYWFYDCCNLVGEVEARAQRTPDSNFTMSFLLDSILRAHAPLVVGYSGWESDVIMSALKRRLQSALPHNLYWFCFNEGELASLPGWLKNHRNVFIVAPESAVLAEPSLDGAAVDVAPESARLPAKHVFDAIIRTFSLETPALTRDPLEFLAQHLRGSLYGGEVTEASDIYGIKSVIARLEHAKQFQAATLGDEAARLELMREAIRRSDYDEAVAIAASMKIEQMEAADLEELRELVTTVMAEADLDAPVLPYDTLNRINASLLSHGAIAYDEWERRLARVLLGKASQLAVGDEAGSIAAYDEIYTRFRETDDDEIERVIAEALTRKAEALWSNRDNDADVIADLVLNRYDDDRRKFLFQWSRALLIKLEASFEAEHFEQTVSYADRLLGELADADELYIAEIRHRAVYSRAEALSRLGHHEQALLEIESLLRQLGEGTLPALRSLRRKALLLNAQILDRAGNVDAALAAIDSAIAAYAEPSGIRTSALARALLTKAEIALRGGRHADALQAAEALSRQFSPVRSRVIRDLVKRGDEIISAASANST